MSGLLALLDDVASIAKVAAASVDDIAGQAAKAGAKAAGAVIDDAAVTPKYVDGFSPAREIPIVAKIAAGSIRNKLLFLLPAAMLLSAYAPWAIMPLLMVGGAYLCYEGAEKVWHSIHPSHEEDEEAAAPGHASAEHLEAEKVAGAVKTDFILSAEIMTIALAELPEGQPVWMAALALAVVAIGITVAVYGGVALIVKLDDIGLWLARVGRMGLIRSFGHGLVAFMPWFMQALMVVGTAAMIWVGGSIVLHGLGTLGLHGPYDWIHHQAEAAAHAVPQAPGLVEWFVTAALDGVAGLALGLVLIPVAAWVINPLIGLFRKSAPAN
jgi:uncharacterized protein